MFGASTALFDALGIDLSVTDSTDYDRLVAVRAQLDEAAFAEALTAAREMLAADEADILWQCAL